MSETIEKTCRVRQLSRMSYGNGVTWWAYKCASESLADCLTGNFFQQAIDDNILLAGDTIIISSGFGQAICAVMANPDTGRARVALMIKTGG